MRLLSFTLAVIVGISTAIAQSSTMAARLADYASKPLVVTSMPEKAQKGADDTDESVELKRLNNLPPLPVPLQDATLAEAINVIAASAEMNFVAPTSEEFPEKVTLSSKLNPWKLLELLSERYRFTPEFKDGIWFFNREQVGALVAKTYYLRHTNLDTFSAAQNTYTSLGSTTTIGGMGSGSSGDSAQNSGGKIFTLQTSQIVDHIRDIIGLPPVADKDIDRRHRIKGEAAGEEVKTEDGSTTTAAAHKSTGKVIYLPSENALYVTTTREKHIRVAEYLKVVDREPKQIRIEARFFDTTHDPKTVIGINPEAWQPGVKLSDITTTVNLGRVRATPYPSNVTLTANDMDFQLKMLNTDTNTKLVNNAVSIVTNNRESYFSVGDEEPFVSANTYNGSAVDGGFGSTQASISIRRIGTSVNVVPTYFEGEEGGSGRIRLVVRVEVGSLKGFRQINSVQVPVVSSQKYEYEVYLNNGETLAFGGLTGISSTDIVKKVPIAGDIPLVGYVFKSKDKQDMQRNLVAYITASVVQPNATVLPALPDFEAEAKAEKAEAEAKKAARRKK